jgi:hypothetical protein
MQRDQHMHLAVEAMCIGKYRYGGPHITFELKNKFQNNK